MSTQPLTRPAAYPPWEGEPYGGLPAGALTDPNELMRNLIREDFLFGMDIVHVLDRSIARLIRGATLELRPGPRIMITLWLPEFRNQRMRPEDPDDFMPIEQAARWHDAELAFSALGAACTYEGVELGFVFEDEIFAYPWHKYCRLYENPPHLVRAWWQIED